MPQNVCRLIVSAMLLSLPVASMLGCRDRSSQRSPSGVRQHALLIGCSEYENLNDSFQLRGPENDVQLMKQLLTTRFGFDADGDDLVVMSAASDASYRPTRANIEREFRRLRDTVAAGEPVVILLAGHGSQQPDNDPQNPADIEPDGRDELFLPCDVGTWNGRKGSVENAIVDDELGQWTSAIVQRGAQLWLIMDSCHSGSGVRGGPAEVSRHVPVEELIPEASLVSNSRSVVATADLGHTELDSPGGMVMTYASQPHETTPERKLPSNAEPSERKFYGLLTYTLCEILSNSRRPMTYNELAGAIQHRYQTSGRQTPTPLTEGESRDNLILGSKSIPDRSRMILRRDADGKWTVNAGAVQGLSPGTVLAVRPPVETEQDADTRPLGHVKVDVVSLSSAIVTACAYDGLPVVDDLPERARCAIVFRDVGDLSLTVAVDDRDMMGQPVPPQVREQLRRELQAATEPLVRLVDQPESARWLVRWDSGSVQLVPSSGIAKQDRDGYQFAPPPVSVAPGWAPLVMARLHRIAKATNLIALAGMDFDADSSNALVLDEPDASLGFQLKLTRSSNNDPLNGSDGGVTLTPNDGVHVEMANRGRKSHDVTLLYVSSSFEIECLFPESGESNRLEPGDKVTFGIGINAETTGLEHLVAIVVQAKGQPVDFCFLSQPSIEQSRDVTGGVLATPLGRLCQSALYGQDVTRGIPVQAAQHCEIRRMTWRVALPQGSPADSP